MATEVLTALHQSKIMHNTVIKLTCPSSNASVMKRNVNSVSQLERRKELNCKYFIYSKVADYNHVTCSFFKGTFYMQIFLGIFWETVVSSFCELHVLKDLYNKASSSIARKTPNDQKTYTCSHLGTVLVSHTIMDVFRWMFWLFWDNIFTTHLYRSACEGSSLA